MDALQKLQSKINTLKQQYDEHVLRAISEALDEHGLTVDDLTAFKGKGKSKPKSVSVKKPRAKTATRTSPLKGRKLKLVAKYRNPETGETWNGHARPPAWLANVKDRTPYLIHNVA